MAQYASVLHKISRPGRDPFSFAAAIAAQKSEAAPLLYFPFEAKLLRTPFRAKVMQQIYQIARQELGNHIASVAVQASADPDEPCRTRLLLSIWADVDKHRWYEADKSISKAVFEQEATWTEDERLDYLKMIDFEVLPLKI